MTPIKIFYHMVDFPGWEDIADEQMTRIKDSGLLDRAELHVNLHYYPESFTQFKHKWAHPNIIWHYSDANPRELEYPTLILMQQMATNSEEEFHALYLHMKGITHLGKDYEQNGRDWRRYMDWFNIVNWRHAIDKLNEGYDTCGVNRQSGPAYTRNNKAGFHYSGNSYWVTASFLRTCQPVLKLPSEANYQCQFPHPNDTIVGGYRYGVEFFVGWNGDKGHSFMNSNRHHYVQDFPEENYINYFNK